MGYKPVLENNSDTLTVTNVLCNVYALVGYKPGIREDWRLTIMTSCHS